MPEEAVTALPVFLVRFIDFLPPLKKCCSSVLTHKLVQGHVTFVSYNLLAI